MIKKYFLGLTTACIAMPLAANRASANVIADLYPGGSGTYTNITGAIVTSVLGTYSNGAETFTVSDGTGSAIFYDNLLHFTTGPLYSPAPGDSFTISSLTNSIYQNDPEVTGFNFTNFSQGAAPPIPVITVAQLNAAGNGTLGVTPYAEAVVTLDNVMLPAGTTSLATKTSYTITDSTGSGILYTSTSYSNLTAGVTNANAAESASGGTLFGGPVDITGYVSPYFGSPELNILSISPAATVPEPVTGGLLAAGTLGLLRRRRRHHSAL